MTTNDESSRNGSFATIAATASVTLAVGVTLAALSGYLTRPGVPNPTETRPMPSADTPPTGDGPAEPVFATIDGPGRAEPALAEFDAPRRDEHRHHHHERDEGDDDD